MTSKVQGASIHLTPNGDSILIFTDEGNLIRARLTPKGYEELSRVHVIDPTYSFVTRKVVWPPPAYANRHIFVRNDEELICASLAEERHCIAIDPNDEHIASILTYIRREWGHTADPVGTDTVKKICGAVADCHDAWTQLELLKLP